MKDSTRQTLETVRFCLKRLPGTNTERRIALPLVEGLLAEDKPAEKEVEKEVEVKTETAEVKEPTKKEKKKKKGFF